MSSSPVIYEFGHFRLDASEETLFCADKPVRLTLKAVKVLLVLIENRGHLVTKEELMRLVWADAFVEEGNLAQTVSTIRKVLGDRDRHHQNHEYIETVARRGYRFIAPVKTHADLTIDDEPARISSFPSFELL